MMFDAEIIHIDRPAKNIAVLTLRPLTGKQPVPFSYRAGQYTDVSFNTCPPRPYSIASAPQASGAFEIHVKDNERGGTGSYVVQQAQIGEKVRFGPARGTAVLAEPLAGSLPILFLARGMGIAPFKALTEAVLRENYSLPLHLYWGAASEEVLYLRSYFEQMEKEHPSFSFSPLVGGDVLDFAFANERDIDKKQIFISGAGSFIEQALPLLLAQGISPGNIKTDHTDIVDRYIFQNAIQKECKGA